MTKPLPSTRDESRALRRGRQGAALAVLICTLALLFGPGVVGHARRAADPWRFNDDARQQIWPLLRQPDADQFRDDYIADYYLANLPRGYRLLYGLGASFADPRTVSKVLPYAELLVVLAALVAATWHLAGAAAAWGTGALCLSTDLYVARMAGGLPRSFALPLVALAVLALVRGAPRSVCVLTVLAAALYYPAAILLGCTAAAYLLVMPADWRGTARAWSVRRRVGVLGATAALAALLGAPALVAGRAFGPRLDRADTVAYPEAGPGGRYGDLDLPLRGKLIARISESLARPLLSVGPPWFAAPRAHSWQAARHGPLLYLIGGIVAVGCAALFAAHRGARRLLALVAAALALYALSLALWPHLFVPSRYLFYGLSPLTPVLVPAGVAALAERCGIRRAAVGAIVVAAVGAIILTLGGRGPGNAGLMAPVPTTWRPLYGFIAGLPPAALIAGWPDEVIDNVPYVSGRSILVGFESHQAFHRGYADEMRRRMAALIDAYFAADVAPLRRLQREFGVTHLLVNRDHYRSGPPTYFKPFDAMIVRAARQAPPRVEPLRQAGGATVFATGPLVLLDLSRLSPPAVRVEK